MHDQACTVQIPAIGKNAVGVQCTPTDYLLCTNPYIRQMECVAQRIHDRCKRLHFDKRSHYTVGWPCTR
jgi:hypothetical protein